MIYYTSDWHIGHINILKFCDRPFKNIKEMNKTIINNHNEVVTNNDTVYHLGDLTFKNWQYANSIIKKLNGTNFFIKGNHDYWLKNGVHISTGASWDKAKGSQIIEHNVERQHIVLSHYAMKRWPRSHYNSWHLFGHTHGTLINPGKSYDVGIDNNNFYPISFDQLKIIMKNLPNNEDYIK